MSEQAAPEAAQSAPEPTSATPDSQQQTLLAGQQQTESTPPAEGEKPKEQAPQEEKPAEPQKRAPEKYAQFTFPDGFQMGEQELAKFSEVAKTLDLTQEQAQALLDIEAKGVIDQQGALHKTSADWAQQSAADAEFGGDKLQENVAIAQKALATFGTPELKSLLQQSGLGNHPEIIRAFYRAGKAIADDTFVPNGTGKTTGRGDPANTLYPNTSR